MIFPPGHTGRRVSLCLLLFCCLLHVAPALAAGPAGRPAVDELRIGLEVLPFSADPHQSLNLNSQNLAAHVYEPLVTRDGAMQLVPALATGWEMLPDGSWRFHLRQGVRFHHGGSFQAVDVVYSLCRVLASPGAAMAALLRRLTMVEPEGEAAILFRPRQPETQLPMQLVALSMLDAPAGWQGRFDPAGCAASTGPDSLAFDRLAAADGTGPYRLAGFRGGTLAELERFEDYWGPAPVWRRVRLEEMADAARRNRALLVGDVDLVNAVSVESLAHFVNRPDIHLVQGALSRSYLLLLNQRPGVLAADPPAPAGNPLADNRVRQAIMLGIDRAMLAQRLLLPGSVPGSQLVPPGHAAYQPDLPAIPFDPAQAQALMLAAGHAGGFAVTLDVPETAEKLGTVLARALARAGIRAQVRLNPPQMISERSQRGDFQILLLSVNMAMSDYTGIVRNMLASSDAGPGYGSTNRGGYRSAEMDGLVIALQAAVPGDGEWTQLAHRIAELAQRDVPLIPVAHTGRIWALRDGLAYAGRVDGLTLATDITPSQP